MPPATERATGSASDRASDPVSAPRSAGRRLAALNAVRAAVQGRETLLELLESVSLLAIELLDADAASVNRYSAEKAQYQTLVNVGRLATGEERFPPNETYPASTYPVVTRLLHAGTGYTASLTEDSGVPDENLRTLARFGRSTCLGAPIMYRDEPWGELFVSRQHGREPFDDADLALARDLAGQVAFAAVRLEVRG